MKIFPDVSTVNISRVFIVLFSNLLVGMLLFAVLAARPSQAAGPWYVAPDGDDSNDCLSPGSPCASIQAAVDKAAAGDTVLVASGVYTKTYPAYSFAVVSIDKNITLSGGWDSAFVNQDGASVVDSKSLHGLGVEVDGNITVIIEHFVIMNSLGSGVRNRYAYITMQDCAIQYNASGITNNDGVVILIDSVVSSNEKEGGIINNGNLTVNNSTISANRNLFYSAGGIFNSGGGSVFLSNSTVRDNWSSRNGGGILNDAGSVTLRNTILAGNMCMRGGVDCWGEITSAGYNLIGNTQGCSFTPATGDLTDVDAGLGLLVGLPGAPAYHPLLPTSPAIDAGDPGGCKDHLGNPLNADQRGAARVGRCDIGAYEYMPAGSGVAVYSYAGAPQCMPPNHPFRTPLQAVILDGIGSPASGLIVTFKAPASGPSGVFYDSSTYTTTALADGSGIATAATLTANGQTGSYTATVEVSGVLTTAEFALGNLGWYAAPGGSDENDCQSPASPCGTLQGALDKAGFLPGDTLLAASGTYTGTGEQVVLIEQDAYLSGGWNTAFDAQEGESVVDGQRARRGLSVMTTGFVEVDRFNFQNGWDIDFAGGIVNYPAATLTLNRVIVANNHGAIGGIFNDYGTINLFDSLIIGNRSDGEGGGAVYNLDGVLKLVNSTVRDNRADASGGIYNWDGILILENSSIENNVAGDYNGGISNWYGLLTAVNSTISGNSARNSGGAILNYEGDVNLANSTVSDNSVYMDGGGIWNQGGEIVSKNSILAGNRAETGLSQDCDGAGEFVSLGYNLLGDMSGCVYTASTGDLAGLDASLGPLVGLPGQPRYHPLLPTSPAIEAGDPAGCVDFQGSSLESDQRGAARVGCCDIGAYEYTTPGLPVSVYAYAGTPQSTLPCQVFREPLRALALDSIGSPAGSITITFSAPSSGASGIFSTSLSITTTEYTQGDGLASAYFIANAITSSYTVTASASGVITPANFLLRNIGWYVAPDGDDENDCVSPGLPCANIDGATGKPGFTQGDTVLVASGIYTGAGAQVVTVSEDVRLSGGWTPDFILQDGVSVIDGQSSRRGIWIADSVKTFIERFSIQNGLASGGDGGGVYLDAFSSLELHESAVFSNTAVSGGGIYQGRASVVNLQDSTVRSNMASTGDGGGIYTRGKLNIAHSTLIDNLAGSGGGVYAYGGAIKLSNTSLDGNAASAGGGGIYASFSMAALENVLFNANRALNGGGMYNRYAEPLFSNVTLSANQASGVGGTLYNDHSSPHVLNSVLCGNQSPGGEQVYNDANSIPVFSYSLVQDGCPVLAVCDHLLAGDPLFVRPASPGADGIWGTPDDDFGDLRLASGSPAIDAGDNDSAPAEALDLGGKPRFFDVLNVADTGNGTPPIIDMGAYETERASTAITITAHLPEPSLVGQPVTVTFLVKPILPVTGTPTGLVTISDGNGAECASSVAIGQCVITPTIAGSKLLTSFYAGDEDFNTSSASELHQVNKANISVSLASSANPSLVGQTVTFTAALSVVAPGSGVPIGEIEFRAGGNLIAGCEAVSLVDGQAICSTTTLPAGTHVITAEYGGNACFNSSTGTLSPDQRVNFRVYLPMMWSSEADPGDGD